jgi:uncharacterized membrane protein
MCNQNYINIFIGLIQFSATILVFVILGWFSKRENHDKNIEKYRNNLLNLMERTLEKEKNDLFKDINFAKEYYINLDKFFNSSNDIESFKEILIKVETKINSQNNDLGKSIKSDVDKMKIMYNDLFGEGNFKNMYFLPHSINICFINAGLPFLLLIISSLIILLSFSLLDNAIYTIILLNIAALLWGGFKIMEGLNLK